MTGLDKMNILEISQTLTQLKSRKITQKGRKVELKTLLLPEMNN